MNKQMYEFKKKNATAAKTTDNRQQLRGREQGNRQGNRQWNRQGKVKGKVHKLKMQK